MTAPNLGLGQSYYFQQGKNMNRLLTLLFLLIVNVNVFAESASTNTVRLAIVNTPVYSGLIDYLLADFEQQSGLHVDVTNGSDVFDIAKSEHADIVIAHFGKAQFDRFVLDGFGQWPKMVFSNQAAIIGPSDDPANIKGLTDASQALRQIAQTQAKFITSPQPGVDYLTDLLWNKAGKPDKADWFIDFDNDSSAAVAKLAEQQHAYFIWGAIPFLKYKKQHGSTLAIVVNDDPLFQRVMASSIVNPNKVNNSNYAGAKQLQDYLLLPTTQAKIAAFRSSDSTKQLWWPAGRHN